MYLTIKKKLRDFFKFDKIKIYTYVIIVVLVVLLMLGNVFCAGSCNTGVSKTLEVSNKIVSPGITSYFDDNLYLIHYGDRDYVKEGEDFKPPKEILVSLSGLVHFAFDILLWYLLASIIKVIYVKIRDRD